MSMSSVIQVNRIYLIFNHVHFLVDSSETKKEVVVRTARLDNGQFHAATDGRRCPAIEHRGSGDSTGHSGGSERGQFLGVLNGNYVYVPDADNIYVGGSNIIEVVEESQVWIDKYNASLPTWLKETMSPIDG